jgi:bacterioferritin-associated ferredoxin
MSGKTLFCRCEDVTLTEIAHAYDEGHHDVESLKRYTGFGTGWCQGKQCVVLCARFIASKTGAMPGAPVTPRPPLHPVPLGMLATLGESLDPEKPSR